ncbi:MAG: septal ring lytic transglycosylase RlpA family protein [Bryobacteraceae bacterium]
MSILKTWRSIEWTAFLLALTLAGCAHKRHVRTVPPRPVAPGYTETGIASWYGHPYHGRPAADGEIYDMEKMTAAHRTLPFNTWVRVENLSNSKSVEVRIIDRGPFVAPRILDVSHAAAEALGMIGPGTARVRLVVIRAPEPVAAGTFAVQVGAYENRQSAEQVRARMASRYGSARLVLREGNPNVWRVLVGAETTEDGANGLAARIRDESGEKNAFVVRLDS